MSKSKKTPRVLVISVNCFSESNSNGRVLGEFFRNWNSNCVAQLYINYEKPDFDICQNYYRITDRDLILKFLGNKIDSGKINPNSEEFKTTLTNNKKSSRKIPPNPLTYLMRDAIWLVGGWKSNDFFEWIEQFNPEVILYYAGNSSFLINLSLNISKKYNLPIVVYNTENYYFKKHNYLKGNGFGLIYPLFRKSFRYSYKKLMKKSIKQIHLNDYLCNIHNVEFQKNGEVIYHSSSLSNMMKNTNDNNIKFLYAGNLGLERYNSLIQIAKVLHSLSSKYTLDVYGVAPNHDIETKLKQTKGLNYHGVVSYEEVVSAMQKTDFLLHVESFDPYYVKDLVAAFSTKIADCLSCGKCLILYAHESLACSQYIQKYDCACLISDSSKLKDSLSKLISSKEMQQKYVENALKVANNNHNNKKNMEKFKKILLEAIESFV